MTSPEIGPESDCWDRAVESRVARCFYNNLPKIILYISLFSMIFYFKSKANRACMPDEVIAHINSSHVRMGERLYVEAGVIDSEGASIAQTQEASVQAGNGATLEIPKQPIFPGSGVEDHQYLIRKFSPNYTELMDVAPPPFLENYKNPCWLERVTDPLLYNGNVFYEDDQYKEYFWMMEKKLSDRVKAGKQWRVRCFPYFFVAGFPKCGTTDLYDKLTLHPDIAVGAAKEPMYWTRWRVGWTHHGYIPISQYLDMFDNAAMEIEDHVEDSEGQMYHGMIHGDGSVNTIWENHWWNHLPDSAKNASGPHYLNSDYISHIYPGAKIIVILRNPTTRLYSDYLFFNSHQQKSVEDFHKQTSEIIGAFQKCFAERPMRDCMVDFKLYTINDVHPKEGLYSVFLEDWLRHFPREQLFVTRLEDFSKDRLNILNQIYQFLGLRALPDYIASTVNEMQKAAYQHVEAGDMLPETKKLIEDFYRPYNEKLVTLLHDHKYLWQ